MKAHRMVVVFVVGLLFMATLPAWAAAKGKVLHNFGASGDGTLPWDSPILDSQGNLYGVTLDGGTGQCGTYGCGTVYQLAPRKNNGWKETIIRDSSSKDGSPWGPLVLDPFGNLYGTTQGEAFELSRGSGKWTYSVLYSAGAGPGVLLDGTGNLYGQMGAGKYGEGAIAELSPGSGGWNYTDLYDFCSPYMCPDGYDLPAPPIWDGKGNMFGTTLYSEWLPPCWIAFGCGVIFEMTPNGDGTWTYHVLYRFLEASPGDGQTPSSGLVMDASGNFYGTTGVGGRYNIGTVFQLSFSDGKWKETILYDFPDPPNGAGPGGQMAFDKAGNLYGANGGGNTTCNYGQSYCGMIYKLTPQKNGKWKYSSVYKFHGPDGWGPNGVTLDGKGHIYGTTVYGGKYGFGTAFEITLP